MSNRLPLLLVLAVVGLSAYLFFTFFERYTEIEDRGWSKAARLNPFLAAELYLSQSDSEQARSVQSAINLDMVKDLRLSDTVFIANSSQVLSKNRLQSLLEWLRGGGHLIVAAQAPQYSDSDYLLNYFSITVEETNFRPKYSFNFPSSPMSKPEEERSIDGDTTQQSVNRALDDNSEVEGEEDRGENNSNRPKPQKLSDALREYNRSVRAKIEQSLISEQEEVVPEEQLTHLEFDGGDFASTAQFDSRRALKHSYFEWDEEQQFEGLHPFYWTGDSYGIHFMQFDVGEGLLTVLSDAQIWQSDSIGQLDHAYLLQTLAANDQDIKILYGLQMPSIFQLLWRWAPELIVVLALLLVAWLRFRGQRFGPLTALQITTRRSLLEHISAASSHYWQRRQFDKLLQPLQDDISRLALHKIHNYDQLKPQQQYLQLSSRSTLSVPQIEYALHNRNLKTQEEFLQQIQTLQKIRKSL